jgi:hypothetical protein
MSTVHSEAFQSEGTNMDVEANELGLADVAEALRPLLEQTQEHVRDLQTALGD